jgi:LmbE family N-acetylglucosaminyl deacetylase
VSGCDVLAVFAHPDDESLVAGGTLAACAAAHLRVGVISLTRGELGVVDGRRGSDGAELAVMRERELAEAAAVLGAEWGRCLELPDGELASVDRAGAVDAVAGIVSAHEPRSVVSFAAEGLYWHPDHIAVHEIVREAVAAGSICELTWPLGLLARTIEELRRRELPTDMWGLDPEAFGAPSEAIAHDLDVAPFLDVKLRALRCHRTQLTAGHALTNLPADLALRLLGREWLTVGEQSDWLAGVVADSCARRRMG